MIARLVSLKLLPCFAAVTFSAVAFAATPEASAKFQSAAPYGVPGVTLPAGKFTIDVESHLTDRYIVHIEDQAGDVLATFLGIPSKTLSKPSDGKVNWSSESNGTTYLKGWYFPAKSLSLEFVYPKAEAVAIAQTNHARVAAIDPASDGLLIPTPKDLSAKDLQVVTLWLLTPTKVGATGADGIQAKRYDQVASLEHKPALHQLPHTASNLAWFYVLGSLATVGAVGLRLKQPSA